MLANPKLPILCAFLTSVLAPALARADAPDEASRVRILLVLDTDDKQGVTWGLDGDNMQAVLQAALRKQKLDARSTIDIFTGSKVTPEKILGYYASLQTQPSETLVFYYSGHGGLKAGKGHFLALHAGHLYRKDLLAALTKHRTRLVVVLTDCCANPAGGAIQGEPPNATIALSKTIGAKNPRALVQEPPGEMHAMLVYESRDIEPKRPNLKALANGTKALREEPPFTVATLTGKLEPAGPKAKREEPEGTYAKGVNMVTGNGTVAVDDIAAKTDGLVLRQLLFQPAGIVDINGCKMGHVSLGTKQWGGSLFTNVFLALQIEKVAALDKNGDHVVQWSEFLPAWESGTDAAGQRATSGKAHQIPEALQLKTNPNGK